MHVCSCFVVRIEMPAEIPLHKHLIWWCTNQLHRTRCWLGASSAQSGRTLNRGTHVLAPEPASYDVLLEELAVPVAFTDGAVVSTTSRSTSLIARPALCVATNIRSGTVARLQTTSKLSSVSDRETAMNVCSIGFRTACHPTPADRISGI